MKWRAIGMVAALLAACAAPPAADTRRSGFEFMSTATQALQTDDTQNPGMLWVQDGEALWNHPVGPERLSCAGCHGDARRSMRGVAARYPRFDAALGRPVALDERIAMCRARQQAPALPPESSQGLALQAFVAHQSRGLPIAPDADPRLAPFRARGEQLYRQRIGQLDLSCASCHDEHAGASLGGSTIPQAHPTGYPLYRLEWQGLGSLQRRQRNCMGGVRAEPFAYGAAELVELELYLMERARGMPIEAPAVRP